MRVSRVQAYGLLLAAAAIWGVAFVPQIIGVRELGVIGFLGIRFALASLAFLPLAIYEARNFPQTEQNIQPRRMSNRSHLLAILTGIVFTVSIIVQHYGLVTATATNAGFLTSLYILFVPFLAWFIAHRRPRSPVIAACLASVFGVWLLTGGTKAGMTEGDILILVSDVGWAIHIVLISMFMKESPRPFFLCLVQSLLMAITGIIWTVFVEPTITINMVANAWIPILYAAFLSGVFAFAAQAIAQNIIPPSEAALVMSTESVFAAIAGFIFLGENFTLATVFGGGIIILAVTFANEELLCKIRSRISPYGLKLPPTAPPV